MKQLTVLLLLHFIFHQQLSAQIKWRTDNRPAEAIAWNNYSTSYIGDVSDSVPFLVTAIPYNGMYGNTEDNNAPLDLSFDGSLFQFQSTLSAHSRRLNTYDSSEVYFLTPGIYKNNAADYEYRVSLNARTVLTPWMGINTFSDMQLNTFHKGFGFLGGYKTQWGNYIIVELRRKSSDTIVSTAMVYWKEREPVVNAIYTTKNLNDFFNLLKRPWDKQNKPASPSNNAVFPSTENTIIFYLSKEVFKKEAIEYQLVKDGEVIRNWRPNDFDNNFIWLKELEPGNYQLSIRYSNQRHQVATYDFKIKPAWHQTITFKFIGGSLIAAFFGCIILAIRLVKARKKIADENAAKEKLRLELKSIYAQFDPHFVFNCLSSIQGLVNKNELESANRYLSEFASLLRHSLVHAQNDCNTLQSEIAMLEKYLKLEQLRFRFQYDIQTDPGINCTETVIPSLLLQPLLENAVKHGVSGMQEKGKIWVRFIKEQMDLHVIISDNGKGFTTDKPTHGYGLKLTAERLRLLNAISKSQPILLTLPGQSGPASDVHLLFKNWWL